MTVYEQVDDAIHHRLHLGAPPKIGSMHGIHWHYPVEINHGNIVMRDSDCGLAKPTWVITTDEWSARVACYGLWRSVGIWDFVRADDPATNEIAYAHRNPSAAGRELYELRQKIKLLETT